MADKDKQKFYWVKLDKDFFQKYKIKSLISEKNGEKSLIIYQQLMCECLNYVDEKGNGILRFSQNRAYTINELASVINRKPKELQEALKTLINKELLEVWDDGTIYIYEVNVGSITGQTIRKNKGKYMVETTNELPKNYQENEVISTLDIRDKSIEIRDKNIEEDIIDNARKVNLLISNYRESGYNEDHITKTIGIFDKCKVVITPKLFQQIFNVVENEEIVNKDGYAYELFRKEGVIH